MRILLCALAIAVHGAMTPLRSAVLCIGVDGHVALENGTSPCCGPEEGRDVAKPASPDLYNSPEPPCPGCRDIPLDLAGAEALRDPQPSSCGPPSPPSWAVGWTPEPAVALVSPPASRTSRSELRALADLRTIVLRR